MAHYVARVPVSAARPAAFAYPSRFDRAADGHPGVETGEMVTGEPVGVGSRFRLVARFLGRRIPLDYEIAEYDRDERIVLRAENRSVRSVDTITFEDDDHGSVGLRRGNSTASSCCARHRRGARRRFAPRPAPRLFITVGDLSWC